MTELETILRENLLFDDFQKVTTLLKEYKIDEIIDDFLVDKSEARSGREDDMEEEIDNLKHDIKNLEDKLDRIKSIADE